MPTFNPNLSTGVPNLHVDPNAAKNLSARPSQQQNIDPVSVLQRAVQALQDNVAALQSQNTALIAQNGGLASRVSDLENTTGPMKIVVHGMNLAMDAAGQKTDALRADFSAHTHGLPFLYESFAFLTDTPDNNKPNFLVPYVWEGVHQEWTDAQREQNAEVVGGKTSSVK